MTLTESFAYSRSQLVAAGGIACSCVEAGEPSPRCLTISPDCTSSGHCSFSLRVSAPLQTRPFLDGADAADPPAEAMLARRGRAVAFGASEAGNIIRLVQQPVSHLYRVLSSLRYGACWCEDVRIIRLPSGIGHLDPFAISALKCLLQQSLQYTRR